MENFIIQNLANLKYVFEMHDYNVKIGLYH